MTKPRVLLFGAGGVGIIYVYILRKGGADVTAVCRSNYAAAKANGFTIKSQVFGTVHVKPDVVRSVADAQGPWDYIVICSKALPSTAAAQLIQPAVGPGTSIVLAQNGIGLEDEYAARYPQNPIISGVVYLPTTQEQPAVVEMGNLELLEIGTFPADAPPAAKEAAARFAALFEAAGATIKVYDDIQPRRWSKLAVNASWNPVCALSLCSDAQFLNSSEEAISMIESIMHEVLDIADSLGYRLSRETEIEWQLARSLGRRNTEGKEPSMLTDVRNGRRIEVEAIVGNAVRIARKQRVQTKMLDLVYALAKGLDASIERQQEVISTV